MSESETPVKNSKIPTCFFETICKSSLLPSLVIALVVTGLRFYFQGHIDIDLADEGYLWYGGQRTAVGEIPIRDFMAYDPGRYYWVASAMQLFNNRGVMTLRIATYAFDFVGLAVALSLLGKEVREEYKIMYLSLVAIVLSMWMYPHNKTFDYSSSIFLIGILAYLVAEPTNRRYFLAGFVLGLVAFIGRNHGVYGLVASAGVLAWLHFCGKGRLDSRKVLYWIAGGAVGFSPMIFLILFCDGFLSSFFYSIAFLFEIKGTNLPKPIPWPWLALYDPRFIGEYVRDLLTGVAFIGVAAFGIGAMAYVSVFKKKSEILPPAFVSSAFLALPYAHYAFSRADVVHLAQAAFPALIGCFALVVRKSSIVRWFFLVAIALSSYWLMHYFQPGTRSYFNGGYKSILVSGDQLLVHPNEFFYIDFLRNLNNRLLEKDQSFIVTPLSPGGYPVLDRRSPMWEINALFPRSDVFQKSEIDRIRSSNPGLVVIEDVALDGRDELRFKNTHRLIYQYILDNFYLLSDYSDSTRQVYKIKVGNK